MNYSYLLWIEENKKELYGVFSRALLHIKIAEKHRHSCFNEFCSIIFNSKRINRLITQKHTFNVSKG